MKVLILDQHGYRVRKLNRRKAIRERCLNCSNWVPKKILGCTFENCSLFPFRMGKGNQNAKARAKAIRDFCRWCMNSQTSEIYKCRSITCSLYPYRKSRVDRSVDLDLILKTEHIAVSSGMNISQSIPKHGCNGELRLLTRI